MLYREYRPAPSIAHAAVRYWAMEVGDVPAGHVHRVLPDGCLDVVVVRRGAWGHVVVRGPRVEPLLVPVTPGDRYWGIRLWPDAAPRLFGVAADALVGVMAAAGDLVGAEVRALPALLADAAPDEVPALLDAWLAPRVSAMPPLDGAVRLALLALHASRGTLGTARVASLVALGPRQLQRRFRDATGLTIKAYARIRRLRGSIAHLVDERPRTWGEVAHALGYADQSHLAAEFARLAGATPREVAAYVAGIRHLDVEP